VRVPVVDLRDEPAAVAAAIDRACRDVGFFCVRGHGVDAELCARLDALSREFFALDDAEKAEIAMERAGHAWRGWFPVGGELTAGVPDLKEGIYFGEERPPDPRPLHGPNLFPRRPAALRAAVLAYMESMTALGRRLLADLAPGVRGDPTLLFRIFHYPPGDTASWGVGEHTDYGLLTILMQDDSGGLEVRSPAGWVEVPPQPGTFVCNIGDVLERLSGGAYVSTAHRVRNVSGRSRLSFPFFFDPPWEMRVPGSDGTYGEYLVAKVSRVFPALRDRVLG
jgi:isopenicillin N synthase-like dioxygenase